MSAETLRLMCPNLVCRKILAVPTTARGKTVRCRSCQTNIRVPGVPESAPKKASEPTPDSSKGAAA